MAKTKEHGCATLLVNSACYRPHTKYREGAGPGLAQLVERLAHRHSESTSSNPGNLTSATVCGDRTGCMPAAKRSASVAPEVDLGERTLHSPLQCE